MGNSGSVYILKWIITLLVCITHILPKELEGTGNETIESSGFPPVSPNFTGNFSLFK